MQLTHRRLNVLPYIEKWGLNCNTNCSSCDAKVYLSFRMRLYRHALSVRIQFPCKYFTIASALHQITCFLFYLHDAEFTARFVSSLWEYQSFFFSSFFSLKFALIMSNISIQLIGQRIPINSQALPAPEIQFTVFLLLPPSESFTAGHM